MPESLIHINNYTLLPFQMHYQKKIFKIRL